MLFACQGQAPGTLTLVSIIKTPEAYANPDVSNKTKEINNEEIGNTDNTHCT